MRSVLLVRIAAFAAGLLVMLALVIFGSSAWLKSRIVKQAAARGFVVAADRARLGWFAARLRNVHVGLEGVPGVVIDLREIDVEVTGAGRPSRVVVTGGALRVEGDPDKVIEDVRAWRARRAASAPREGDKDTAKTERPPLAIVASELAIDAPLPGGGSLNIKDVSFERSGADAKLVATDVRASRGETRAVARELKLALAGFKLRLASLDSLTLEIGPNAPAPGAAVAGAASSASAMAAASVEPPTPTLPVLPVVVDRRGKKKSARVEPAIPSEPLRLDLPDVAPMRARASALARAAADNLADGAEVQIAALSVRVQSGTERLTLGPGRAALVRTPEHVELQFATSSPDASKGKSDSTPLSVRLEVPIAGAELRATLAGGPITFASLGIQENAFGLIDVARAQLSGKATVKIDAQGSMTFDADVTGRSVGMARAWLAHAPVHGLDVGLRIAGLFESKRRLRIDDAEAALGALRLRFRGTAESEGERSKISGSFEVPVSACQSLLDSVPQALMPIVRATNLSGTFGAVGRAALDTTAIDDMELVYRVDDRCRFVQVPRAIDREHFRHPFLHRIVKADGADAEMETGPDSANWTSLESISPYMQAAVLTTEDGAFFRHHGFNHAAIKGSIIANLKAKRFVRGASTITMQLAKNLFLSRQKTISRKLEEVVLTDYLEQTFSKEELIELYLNVVEFGPNIYGIGPAAEHYFGRKPEELTLAESMFFASLLPRPVESHRMYERGAISEGWAKNLRSLIEIAFRTGKISEAERNEGLSQAIVFYKEGQPRPVPRPAVIGARRGNLDEEWKVVE